MGASVVKGKWHANNIYSRWIRLLFGREFPFDDVLELWDVLLAEDPALDLVDMVCVAMLLRVRWQRKLCLNMANAPKANYLKSNGSELFGCLDAVTQISVAFSSAWPTDICR